MIMRIIQIENPVTFLKCKEHAMIKIMLCARDAQEVYLRSQFEISSTNANAVAAIEVAKALGFDKLSSDLTEEYNQTINREVKNEKY